MDQASIFDSISKLEEKLLSTDSASEMVTKNTESYEKVKKRIELFCEQLSELINDIKNFIDNIITFQNEIKNSIKNYEHNALTELSSQSKKIKEQTLKNQLDIKKSTEDQISSLVRNIENQLQTLQNRINNALYEDINNLQETLKNLNKAGQFLHDYIIGEQKELNNKVIEIEKTFNNIKLFNDQSLLPNINEVLNKLKEYASNIQLLLKNEHEELNNNFIELKENFNDIKLFNDQSLFPNINEVLNKLIEHESNIQLLLKDEHEELNNKFIDLKENFNDINNFNYQLLFQNIKFVQDKLKDQEVIIQLLSRKMNSQNKFMIVLVALNIISFIVIVFLIKL